MKNFTAEQLISDWEAVTKEDVKKMAKKIKLEIVYLLSGKEGLQMNKVHFDNLQETLYNEKLRTVLTFIFYRNEDFQKHL